MPHNFLRLGVIKLILPNARVVSCVRDPMDNCLSIFKNYFSANHNYAYDLNELGKYYNLYHSLMEYWRELFPGFIYDIKYEDLVNNPNREINELIKFVKIDIPEKNAGILLKKILSSDIGKETSSSEMKQIKGISNTSIGRWKSQFDGKALKAIIPIIANTMKRIGYLN